MKKMINRIILLLVVGLLISSSISYAQGRRRNSDTTLTTAPVMQTDPKIDQKRESRVEMQPYESMGDIRPQTKAEAAFARKREVRRKLALLLETSRDLAATMEVAFAPDLKQAKKLAGKLAKLSRDLCGDLDLPKEKVSLEQISWESADSVGQIRQQTIAIVELSQQVSRTQSVGVIDIQGVEQTASNLYKIEYNAKLIQKMVDKD
jgi:hypothetical protein